MRVPVEEAHQEIEMIIYSILGTNQVRLISRNAVLIGVRVQSPIE